MDAKHWIIASTLLVLLAFLLCFNSMKTIKQEPFDTANVTVDSIIHYANVSIENTNNTLAKIIEDTSVSLVKFF